MGAQPLESTDRQMDERQRSKSEQSIYMGHILIDFATVVVIDDASMSGDSNLQNNEIFLANFEDVYVGMVMKW